MRTEPRSFIEHTTLVSAFATKVDELSADAWERLRLHCQPLGGTTPEVLFKRAQLFAMPYGYLPIPTTAPAYIRALPVLMRGFQIGVGLTYEVVTSAFPSTIEPPWTRRRSSDKPHFDRMIDANNMIEHAMERHGVRIPSVATGTQGGIVRSAAA